MSTHYVTVTHVDGNEEDPEFSLECSDPSTCDGWVECQKPHEPRGDVGPYDCDDAAAWYGWDEFVFHGQPHRWDGSRGKWVAILSADECPVLGNECDVDLDAFYNLPPGRYEADDDWDDTYLYLTRAATEETT